MRPLVPVLGAVLAVGTLQALAGCEKSTGAQVKRVQLRRTGGTTFELLPAEGQHEHCLAYTVSRGGLMRQLTMSRKNESFHCPAGQAIGSHAFKVPLNEGPVKVFVLFSSLPVNAGSVSQQLLDSGNRQAVNVMDLRLPGAAAMETLDFTPEEDVAATMGEELGADAGTPTTPPDGGPL
jgi:hypothetical protein